MSYPDYRGLGAVEEQPIQVLPDGTRIYASGARIGPIRYGTSNPQNQSTVLVPDPNNPSQLIPVPAKIENGVLVPVDQRYMALLYPQGRGGGGSGGSTGLLLAAGIVALIVFGSR